MLVLDEIRKLPKKKGFRAVALGNFDGVHRGHQALIAAMVRAAKAKGGDSLVFTFHPHPLVVLQGVSPKCLSPERGKEQLVAALGADIFCLYPFDRQVADMAPRAFIQDLVQGALAADHIFVGYNYTFGAQGAGDTALLATLCQELGLGLTVLPPVQALGGAVSSSRIRQAIAAGDIQAAGVMLGYCPYLKGQVIPAEAGRQVGRQMGFPTANIPVPPGLFLPPFGVYAAFFQWRGGMMPAVVNLGIRPTFGLKQPVAEAHLLDFDGDLYGEKATIHFVNQIRRERTFPDLQALSAEIAANKQTAAEVLANQAGLRFFPEIDPCYLAGHQV